MRRKGWRVREGEEREGKEREGEEREGSIGRVRGRWGEREGE